MSSYDQYSFLKVETRDAIAVCTLNRPDALNAVNRQAHVELEALFVQLAQDADVRAVVLTGAGRAFCAGGDVKEMGSGTYTRPGGIFDSGARQLVAKLLSI
jgi:enoyl-CoA hydratase/carnithine racemase